MADEHRPQRPPGSRRETIHVTAAATRLCSWCDCRPAKLASGLIWVTESWGWSALGDSQLGRDTEFLVDLRPELAAPRGEQNPVVNLAVGNHEAHRVPLGYGCLPEGNRRRFE